jgi:hypothetical protein
MTPRALPPVRVTFAHVLILEWLNNCDDRTGEKLHQFLQSISVPSYLVVCRSADDVREALAASLRDINSKGRPVVHIEAHGSDPQDTSIREMEFGMSAARSIPWTDLGDWLAPLNTACQFQLLVVGATCFGFGTIAAMKVHDHIAPFAGAVGFTTSVFEGSLLGAMKELYRSMTRGAQLVEAVENANRELRSADETLRLTTSPMLAMRVLRGVYDGIRTPQAVSERVKGLLKTVEQAGLQVPQTVRAELPGVIHERSRIRMKEAWDGWFPIDLQERDVAYRLDWSLIEADIEEDAI